MHRVSALLDQTNLLCMEAASLSAIVRRLRAGMEREVAEVVGEVVGFLIVSVLPSMVNVMLRSVNPGPAGTYAQNLCTNRVEVCLASGIGIV